MIIDSQTNFLYLADTLPTKYPNFYKLFEEILKRQNIRFALLPGTKDIWAVDYMPIQCANDNFIQFKYNPTYLQSERDKKTISNVDEICRKINLNPVVSDIVLDGGNIVKCSSKVIMTDRVFIDNPSYERKVLTNKLRDLLEVDNIFFIPEQPGDFTGHADGMIRFVDENTVLINDYKQEKEWFHRAFEVAVQNMQLDYVKIPYNIYHNKNDTQANGNYINYLQMKSNLVIPVFGIKEDEIIVKIFQDLFPKQTISSIESNDIANHGGILNCISWNIIKDN